MIHRSENEGNEEVSRLTYPSSSQSGAAFAFDCGTRSYERHGFGQSGLRLLRVAAGAAAVALCAWDAQGIAASFRQLLDAGGRFNQLSGFARLGAGQRRFR